MSLPKHIVLIPDGNRRWAGKKSLPSFMGHRAGAKTAEKLLKTALDADIEYVTFWGSSLDNVAKRSPEEVELLMKLFESYFKKVATSEVIRKNKVRITILGRWKELFPASVAKVFQSAIDATKHHDKRTLTFLMAYSGVDEMRNAVERISELRAKKKDLEVGGDLIKQNLWTKDLPAVDLVIRTGGEPHWSSGLMMWDVADSQLYFTDTLFPDFSPAEFTKALERYAQTERRKGK